MSFQNEGGQQKLTQYPLRPDSIVFDVGGYHGGWTAELLKEKSEVCKCCGVKQDPHIYIFEPIREFYNRCVDRFRDFPKVRVFNFGLSGHDHVVDLYLNDAGTSIIGEGSGSRESVWMRDVDRFVNEQDITRIELISINIEGGEYDLLHRMIDTRLIKRCRNVQVQFHKIGEDYQNKIDAVHRRLQNTHQVVFDYPFVWESWKRIS